MPYWRLYRTAGGRRIIRDEINALDPIAFAAIFAAMDDVEELGASAASAPVSDKIREIDADGEHGTTFRLLFGKAGRNDQILLAVVVFEKKTRKTPKRFIELAERRLDDWESRQFPSPDPHSKAAARKKSPRTRPS
ncbi:MAG: type II toxin-antitoxin system RelE/ParE family toxin [Candidatus Limnocylindrales bacterium]